MSVRQVRESYDRDKCCLCGLHTAENPLRPAEFLRCGVSTRGQARSSGPKPGLRFVWTTDTIGGPMEAGIFDADSLDGFDESTPRRFFWRNGAELLGLA